MADLVDADSDLTGITDDSAATDAGAPDAGQTESESESPTARAGGVALRTTTVERSTPLRRKRKGTAVAPSRPAVSTQGDVVVIDDAGESAPERDVVRKKPASFVRLVGVCVPILLVALLGVVGYVAYEQHEDADAAAGVDAQREAVLQAGRQVALNLTTIRHDHVDADVNRILNSTADPFRAEFAGRAESFKSVVKQAKSASAGELGGAGIESFDGTEGRVVVAANVTTSNAGQKEQDPRSWRMRLTVSRVDGRFLATNVEFVP